MLRPLELKNNVKRGVQEGTEVIVNSTKFILKGEGASKKLVKDEKQIALLFPQIKIVDIDDLVEVRNFSYSKKPKLHCLKKDLQQLKE